MVSGYKRLKTLEQASDDFKAATASVERVIADTRLNASVAPRRDIEKAVERLQECKFWYTEALLKLANAV